MVGDRTWEGGMGWNSTGRRKEGWVGLRLMKEHNKEGWKNDGESKSRIERDRT